MLRNIREKRVVIGSAIVDRIEAAEGRTAAIDAVGRFISEAKAALTFGNAPLLLVTSVPLR